MDMHSRTQYVKRPQQRYFQCHSKIRQILIQLTPRERVSMRMSPDLARARFEDFEAWSKRAVTLISGLRIKKGVLRKIRIQLVDIARTIADFVGFPIPTRSEGKILCDLLE